MKDCWTRSLWGQKALRAQHPFIYFFFKGGKKKKVLSPEAAVKERFIRLRSGSCSAYWLVFTLCVCAWMHRLVLFIKKIFVFSFCQGSGCLFFLVTVCVRVGAVSTERAPCRVNGRLPGPDSSASSLPSLWHETEPTKPNTRGAASRPAERSLKPPTLKGQGRLLWLCKSCSTVFRYQLNFVEFLFF